MNKKDFELLVRNILMYEQCTQDEKIKRIADVFADQLNSRDDKIVKLQDYIDKHL